ncbi:MAG: hypothetical protein A2Z86_02680 [Candidatus Glassbacteria bacterium GWA2_58_10]|uniref:Uncharacterized protein n=1 Tax=Candidatus Glassbacteria bacterium GWA2_58_10 TaxID=1817865 RepID=A0A1F5YD47_9BACT|nr:MAG: hypothetical protein A2Z86_02680 [Candidatus Glassbacteria bacterium GWA2_58_10]
MLSYNGNSATWLSDPAGERGVLSSGKSRAFLTSLLPSGVKITKRGGEGYDFWGHPDEATAQYNHVGRGSRQPPIVPWRLEEQSPGKGLRDYFLNVIEIGDENDSKASEASLVEREGFAGARLDAAGTPVEVLFSREGALTARVKIGAGAESVIEPGIQEQ